MPIDLAAYAYQLCVSPACLSTLSLNGVRTLSFRQRDLGSKLSEVIIIRQRGVNVIELVSPPFLFQFVRHHLLIPASETKRDQGTERETVKLKVRRPIQIRFILVPDSPPAQENTNSENTNVYVCVCV